MTIIKLKKAGLDAKAIALKKPAAEIVSAAIEAALPIKIQKTKETDTKHASVTVSGDDVIIELYDANSKDRFGNDITKHPLTTAQKNQIKTIVGGIA